MKPGILPMEPIAPIIDQMREIAEDELPSPRTLRMRMWEDGTFDAYIYRSMSEGEFQLIRYERTTSEVIWAHDSGASRKTVELTGGETIYEPEYKQTDVDVITDVEPPYG